MILWEEAFMQKARNMPMNGKTAITLQKSGQLQAIIPVFLKEKIKSLTSINRL